MQGLSELLHTGLHIRIWNMHEGLSPGLNVNPSSKTVFQREENAARKLQKPSKNRKQRGDTGDLPSSSSPADLFNATTDSDSYSNNSWVFGRAERRNDARKVG